MKNRSFVSLHYDVKCQECVFVGFKQLKCNGMGRQGYVPHMYVIEVNNGNNLEMFDASIWILFVVCNEEFIEWCLCSDRIILYVYFSVIFVCFFTGHSNWGSWLLSKYLRSFLRIIGAYNVDFISKYWVFFTTLLR